MANDPVSGAVIRDEFAHWDDIVRRPYPPRMHPVVRPRLHRHRPQAAARILQQRARALGVALHFETEASADLGDWTGYDLVIAADGANSRSAPATREHFGLDAQILAGATSSSGSAPARVFDAFTFAFEQTEAGWVWAHAYPVRRQSLDLHRRDRPRHLGRARPRPDGPARRSLCRKRFFADISTATLWCPTPTTCRDRRRRLNFRIVCDRWAYRNLLSCSATPPTPPISRSASGTKLALEDSIKLAEVLNRPGLDRAQALINVDSATSRCSSSRTARATDRNGSRRRWSRYPPFRADPVRLFFAHPLAGGVAPTRICGCATSPGASRASSAGWRLAPAAARSTSRRRRCSRRSGCARWNSPTASSYSRRWRCYSAVDGCPERLPPRPLRRPRHWRRRARLLPR